MFADVIYLFTCGNVNSLNCEMIRPRESSALISLTDAKQQIEHNIQAFTLENCT